MSVSCGAEATCTSQIRTARAVAQEFGEQASSIGSGLLEWARIPEYNSERDAQKLMDRQGLKLPLKLDTLTVGSTTLPWIRPRTWLTYIIRAQLWHRICGLADDAAHMCGSLWLRFWSNYRLLYPNFELFGLPNLDLSRTAAFYIHGDEGRGLKRQAFMITNLQCAVGYGSGPQDRKHANVAASENSFRLKLNNLQSSYLTRFITLLIPKWLYENETSEDMYLDMLDCLGQDLEDLLTAGVADSSGNVFRICCIGVKGDLPYLSKVSFSERSFLRAARGGPKGSKGVCHLCCAGQPGFPAEQVGSRTPRWLDELPTTPVPWTTVPPLTRWLLHDPTYPASFYKMDLWHIYHLGIGRAYVASTIVLCLAACVGVQTLDGCFNQLTRSYLAFCKSHGLQPHIRKISKDFVSYGDQKGINGYWNKGGLTTNLMVWLEHYLQALQPEQDSLFMKALLAAQHINRFFRILYDCDAFLNAQQCAVASKECRGFLNLYVQLARECFEAKRTMYPLMPKLHFLDHFAVKLYWDGLRKGLSDNPLQTGCQMDEDAVGRLSRTSRRVNIRKTVERTFQRYLAGCHEAFTLAGWI